MFQTLALIALFPLAIQRIRLVYLRSSLCPFLLLLLIILQATLFLQGIHVIASLYLPHQLIKKELDQGVSYSFTLYMFFVHFSPLFVGFNSQCCSTFLLVGLLICRYFKLAGIMSLFSIWIKDNIMPLMFLSSHGNYIAACPVCYLPVEEAIALMPKLPSFSPIVNSLTYIYEDPLSRDGEFGGSEFGGYPTLKQRSDSYDIRESMSIHCGYAFLLSLDFSYTYL